MTDQELTYLYQTEHSQTAYETIELKYRSSLKRLTWNLLEETFYSIPLDYQDFNSTMYYSFMDCMKHYDIKQTKYSFIQALIIINRTHILRYAAQFIKQKYRASNHMTRICDEIDVDRLPEFGYSDVEKINNILDRNEKIKVINQQLEKEPTKIKSIISLKAKGYNNHEIASRLNLTAKKVSNYFVIFVKRFRLLHPKLIDE